MKCVYCDRDAEHDIPVENAIGSYPVCNKHYLLPPGDDFQEIVLDMLVDLEHKVSMLLENNPQTVELDPNGRYDELLEEKEQLQRMYDGQRIAALANWDRVAILKIEVACLKEALAKC